jgi:D-alanyl-D-alanine carboxypeptidase (penicillin-binding protein 5/6)
VAASAASKDGTSGIGTALAVTGGLLVLVAGAVFLVNRRWPLPDLMRRRR